MPDARPPRILVGDRRARLALAALVALGAVALVAPWLAPFDPTLPLDPVGARALAPSARHWMGTDLASRDVLSRLLAGTRLSLAIGVSAALLAGGVGLGYGAVAGFAGGRTGGAMMRAVDALLAIPRALLLLAVLSLWPRVTPVALVLLLGGTGWFGVARLACAEAAATRTRDYVTAARALGASPLRQLVAHVLPHAAAPVLVAGTLAVAQAIVLEAALSYLGVGLPQPTPTWGNIIRDGRETIGTTWWLTLFPGAALVGTALAVHAVADRLRLAHDRRDLPAP